MGNPWLTGFPWAGTTDYPAGALPWSGTPTCVLPGATYFEPDPDNAPTAQELNYMFNQRDQATLYVNFNLSKYRLVEAPIVATGAAPGLGTKYFLAQNWATQAVYSAAAAAFLANLTVVTAVGDLIEVDFESSLEVDGNASSPVAVTTVFDLESSQNGGGNVVDESKVWTLTAAALSNNLIPLSLKSMIPVTAAGTFNLYLNAYTPGSVGGVLSGVGCGFQWKCVIKHWVPLT
jgi:hypothetical protein